MVSPTAAPPPPAARQADKSKDAPDLKNVSLASFQGRGMPSSSDAEKGVLGSALIAPDEVLLECIEQVPPSYFHLPTHRTIYEELIELWNKSVPVDLITLTQALGDRGKLDQVGGAAVLADLFTLVPTAANASFYVEILRQKYLLREVIRTCTTFAARAYDEQDEVNTLVDEFEQGAFTVNSARLDQKQMALRDHIMQAMENIEKLYDNKGGVTGISTGFADFDRLTSGLHPSEMVVIAARPSMGKTALAMNIAEHVVLNEKKAVAVFSLEMSTQQLIQRLLCSIARLNLAKVRDGFLSEGDFPRLTTAAAKLTSAKLFIDDTPSIPIMELRAKARRLKSKENIDLIIIDYLQLIRSPSKRGNENRQIEIAEVSAGVKALAKELNVPVIVLAQLNRQPETRGGGEPRLSDLRESGSIEQDADVVGLLVRAEYYKDKDDDAADTAGKAELNIAKQRNGPTGRVPLTFLKEFTRFEDRAADPEDE